MLKHVKIGKCLYGYYVYRVTTHFGETNYRIFPDIVWNEYKPQAIFKRNNHRKKKCFRCQS